MYLILSGKLVFGTLSGKKVVAVKGRFHFYEGYTMNQVVFPVRVMKFLGIQKLFVSNAAGGMGERFTIGDLMIITDHINLQPNVTFDNDANQENERKGAPPLFICWLFFFL